VTWLRIDDQMHAHRKVIAAGNGPVGAWLRLATWSAAQLSDGHVPVAVARTMGTKRELAKLVEVTLLDETPDGYAVHDYLSYNPSREHVLREREKGRQRASASYERRNSSGEENLKNERSAPESSPVLQRPVPARPDPDPYRPNPSTPQPPAPATPPMVSERQKAEAERPRRLPPGVVGHEHAFLVAAYERAATEALGHAWAFDTDEFGAQNRLGNIVATHCPAADKTNPQPWLEREVRAFVMAVKGDQNWVGGYGAKALLRWLNEGRRGAAKASASPAHRPAPRLTPPTREEPVVSAEEREANAKRIADMLAGFGKGEA
jgi:hypothetical protein